MSQWQIIIFTSACTLIGGTLLFVISEFVKVLVAAPLHKYREHVQLTIDRLDYYSKWICNYFPVKPTEEEKRLKNQIENDLRSAATQLKSKYAIISFKRPLVALRLIPEPQKIANAYHSLIYLHNSLISSQEADDHNNARNNHDEIETIKHSLGQS
jgi:hypothetical protein